jgi:hypothetical protein
MSVKHHAYFDVSLRQRGILFHPVRPVDEFDCFSVDAAIISSLHIAVVDVDSKDPAGLGMGLFVHDQGIKCFSDWIRLWLLI